MKKYGVILADPPWAFRAWSDKGKGRSAEQHYPTMRMEDIKALPVPSLAAEDCVLFLWATFPMLKEALEVIDVWGFTYKTVAFTWVKENRKSPGLFWGLGYWTRANAEVCLLATRGSPKRQSAAVHQVILSPIEQHSKKPDAVRERIVALMGDVPRAELFARQETPGWDVWGNEVECSPGLASRLTISPQQD
ncbi:MAG: adenine methyltransferase [Oscillospiraceae bacterium]|nr:adenine methyltransferase [Oscillospiraceae bacterium]